MITSKVKEIASVQFPEFTGTHVYMQPTTLGDLVNDVPAQYRMVAQQITKSLPYGADVKAFITIDEKELQAGKQQRRGGIHIDGNFVFDWSSGGWLNGVPGRVLTPEQHKTQYQSDKGGTVLVSNFATCRGWVGTYDTIAGQGGSMDHVRDLLEKEPTLLLEENKVYLGNSTFIHEGMPVNTDVKRQLFRLTLSEDILV